MTQIYNQPHIPPPLHNRPSPHEHQPSPFQPREFHNAEKQDSPTYSSRQYEGNGWNAIRRSSPIPDRKRARYEASPLKVGDMYQSQEESTRQQPREQLPSLSSLFGSSPHPGRPAQSPYSERHSPVVPAVSPSDPRKPATPIHPDRSYDTSYFQRLPLSHQYSQPPRPHPDERQGIPPLPRPGHLGPSPESPRYESRYGTIEMPRAQAPSSAHSWSPHSQSSRSEYFPRDASFSFRPPSEHRSMHRQDSESRQLYHAAPVAANYPPTPASTVVGDATTGKDVLGPKIWTGTQFLPRFVRQAEVPGEGMCYFYDDGTHCKTVIDGEAVNAHWGVTKAGKPRKRLAIACITCREKKIKCDPDYPRCVQCEKFGRVCKFKNAPRGGQGSPDTPPADTEDIVHLSASSRVDGESYLPEKREHSESVSPRQALRPATPDSDTHHSKRQRNGYNDLTPLASEPSPRPSINEVVSPSGAWADHSFLASPNTLVREWHTNPFTSHPALVTEMITNVFQRVPETCYCMFPEGPFKAWILSNNEKTLDDLMLVYTLLALGTVFSQNPEHKPLGVRFAAISRYACDNRIFSIQLVQSRLLLALYYFANNNPNDAWDFCGMALRAASGLKLNLEMEKTDEAYLQIFPYGLNRNGYAESRRRTFWSCYIMDRFNGFCSGHVSIIHPEDIFLRLPCDFKLFESQTEVQTPFFDVNNPPPQSAHWALGAMAYLINVSTIWGDVMANIYRTSQRIVPLPSNASFAALYETSNQRLREWMDSLPSQYTFTPENLKIAGDSGKIGAFISMHAVYHTTAMKLNRYIQKSTLNSAQLAHHIATAKHHADTLLAIVDALMASKSLGPATPNGRRREITGIASPFVGFAIVSAVDVLTAKVSLSTLPRLITSFRGAQATLAELALFWQSGKNQHSIVLDRIQDLAELAAGMEEQGGANRRGFKFGNLVKQNGDLVFEMRNAIEKTFSRDYDCLYA